MKHIILPKRKAEAISNGLALISLAILFLTNGWWPGILLAILVWIGSRQYFTGRYWDLAVSSIILLSLFFVTFFNIDLSVLVPLTFIIGGIYIVFREYYFSGDEEKKDPNDK